MKFMNMYTTKLNTMNLNIMNKERVTDTDTDVKMYFDFHNMAWHALNTGLWALFFPQSATAIPLFGKGASALRYSAVLVDLVVRHRYTAVLQTNLSLFN